MKEYIEREALLNCIDEMFHKTPTEGQEQIGVLASRRIIREQPAADVAEVRHGRWITTDNKGLEKVVECSVCHSKDYYPPFHFKNIRYPNYCGDCGAKMDVEGAE